MGGVPVSTVNMLVRTNGGIDGDRNCGGGDKAGRPRGTDGGSKEKDCFICLQAMLASRCKIIINSMIILIDIFILITR